MIPQQNIKKGLMVLDPLKTSRISSSSTGTRPDSKRFSVVASYWSYASENDAEVQDELAKCKKDFNYCMCYSIKGIYLRFLKREHRRFPSR